MMQPEATQVALRTEPLAELLDRSRATLLEKWKRRVLDDPAVPTANRLSEPTLRDHIPRLLDRLIARVSADFAESGASSTGPTSGDIAVGVAHAQQRAAVHYSVGEGMRELAHFRATILALCSEERVAMAPKEAEVLHRTLDEIMTASATELDRVSLVLYQRAMAVVAHELRNPLSAIVMGAKRLRGDSLEPSSRAFEVLTRNALLMDRLIADLLTVSTLEAGQFTVSPALVDVCEIVRDACEQHEAAAVARRIDLVAHLPDRPVTARCDKQRVGQALGNLVSNALKFTPELGRVEIRLESDPEHCTLRVADTGPGVAPGDAAAIFQPFWQAPETRGQGTGLGLAIARGIVEAHGGSIALESRSSPGAVFTFTLPRSGPA